MSHRPGHGHAHGHAGLLHHDHHRAAGRRGLKIVLALVGTFMVVEFVGGWLANSLALMADAAHMLTDVVAIALALLALYFARRPAPPEKTYGYLRLEILAALLNGVILILISLGVLWEAYRRLRVPAEVETGIMLAVASAGLVVNVTAAAVLHRSAGHSLNVRGAYIHILGDLLGTLGVLTAALVIRTTGWLAADPITSIVVACLILISAYKLVRESVDILLQSVPAHLDLHEIRAALADIPGLDGIHDLHVWTVTSGYYAMSGHAVIDDPARHQPVLEQVHRLMRSRFGIRHVTFQLEHEAMYHPDQL
jgi:cobalt-zinc-cadmium efflux system protein